MVLLCKYGICMLKRMFYFWMIGKNFENMCVGKNYEDI